MNTQLTLGIRAAVRPAAVVEIFSVAGQLRVRESRGAGRDFRGLASALVGILLVLVSAGFDAAAGIAHYVNVNNDSPVSPFLDWARAATNIQDAVDAAMSGDEIIVTNGIYQSGGRVVAGTMMNRVAVTKPLTLRTVNGPDWTSIVGNPYLWLGAVRCVYLADGAVLSGFTLSNGGTLAAGDPGTEQSGGGVWCETVGATLTNCVLSANGAYAWGGGAYSGTLLQCTLSGNTASTNGGGAYASILDHCVLSGNFASVLTVRTLPGRNGHFSGFGGGASFCRLNFCTLSGNEAPTGGAAYASTLTNCALSANWALELNLYPASPAPYEGSACGAGAAASTLDHCTLQGNMIINGGSGAGAAGCLLHNCMLAANSIEDVGRGGGATNCTLVNCTVCHNIASSGGGGVSASFLTNCIVYSNTAAANANFDASTLDHCCTTPLPTSGAGNITGDPVFMNAAGGDFHLQASSPCVNRGANAAAPGPTDLDGRPRIVGGRVDLGAYEFQGVPISQFQAWLLHYGLPADSTAESADPDGDGGSNWQEFQAGTDPTNALSVLRLLPPVRGFGLVTLTWPSVPERTYWVESSTNLDATAVFLTLATGIPGQTGTTSYTERDRTFTVSNAPPQGQIFYRVGTQR